MIDAVITIGFAIYFLASWFLNRKPVLSASDLTMLVNSGIITHRQAELYLQRTVHTGVDCSGPDPQE